LALLDTEMVYPPEDGHPSQYWQGSTYWVTSLCYERRDHYDNKSPTAFVTLTICVCLSRSLDVYHRASVS